jgi:hypothetical protein
LGGEYLRMRISRKAFFRWLVSNTLGAVIVGFMTHNVAAILGGLVFVNLILVLFRRLSK